MASLKIEIEENKIVRTLSVLGKEFVATMVSNANGGMDGDCSIQAQVEQEHPEWCEIEEVYMALDDIDFAEPDEVMELLEVISLLEQ